MKLKKRKISKIWIEELPQPICPNCPRGETVKPVYALGQYYNAKWRTLLKFCLGCRAQNLDPTAERWQTKSPDRKFIIVMKGGEDIPGAFETAVANMTMIRLGQNGVTIHSHESMYPIYCDTDRSHQIDQLRVYFKDAAGSIICYTCAKILEDLIG